MKLPPPPPPRPEPPLPPPPCPVEIALTVLRELAPVLLIPGPHVDPIVVGLVDASTLVMRGLLKSPKVNRERVKNLLIETGVLVPQGRNN